MPKKTLISAELRLDVKCLLSDKLPIPTALCMAIGEPDEAGIIDYTVSAFLSRQQLREIYKILAKDPKRTQWSQ